MKAAYFDCFSGISGDMVLGALLGAGVPGDRLEAELRRLPVPGWQLSAASVRRGAVTATKANVETQQGHHHRSLAVILDLIERAKLAPRAAGRARAIFERLGQAEAKVHDIPVERVHFHEVGAVDSIVDIVGAAIGFDLLGIEEFFTSPLNLGSGQVKTAHGILPVPAPATAELLRGFACYSTGIERELVTPTGAAIVSTLAAGSGPMPPMRIDAVGVGAGSADLAEQPNMLRLFVGERTGGDGGASETVAVIEASIDDMNPQLYGYFAERALEAGALDVFSTPAQMKKNRPGQLVTVLARPEAADRLIDLLFLETTTLGVRISQALRRPLDREWVTVETAHGPVRMKIARASGRVLNAAPEYEDCRRIAAERGVPLKEVMAEALSRFRSQTGSGS
ncbi:MAG TPA: nickel pincer cofactor biosynthesis protein LarC [Candidatus Dormibacteraeota bacterium]|nr:nickel pincer cofactor biosynthesis protein LarC [Candidatus Dormibacteraeota bacterium]